MDYYKILTILFALGMLILGYLAWKNKYGDKEQDTGTKSGQLISDVGYLKSGIDDIKRTQEKQADKYTDLFCEVGRQGDAIKSAHHRIDTIETNIRTQGQYNGKGME